jgi:hypothetical protein
MHIFKSICRDTPYYLMRLNFMQKTSVCPAIVILALTVSTPLFADDKGKDDKTTSAETTTHTSSGGGGGGSTTTSERSSNGSGGGSAAAGRSSDREPQFSHTASSSRGTPSIAAQFANSKIPKTTADFNRGNHYGGRWSSAKEHPDWSHDGIHFWNHHHYRWYDGGWLILDDDFGVADYADEPVDAGPVSFNAIARRVQAKLAGEGYYTGAMDGRISPEFRKAIEKYQGDHGLHVTGLVDAPVIESLQVVD